MPHHSHPNYIACIAVAVAVPLMAPHVALSEPCCAQSATIDPAEADESDWVGAKNQVATSMLQFSESLTERWGMPQEVKEGGYPGIDLRDVAGYPALIGHRYEQQGLVGGQYVLYQRHQFASNEFIGHFLHVKDLLVRTYGTPRQDNVIWLNDLYQPLPGYWDVAVDIGHLVYSASWTTPTTCLALTLKGDTHTKLTLDVSRRTNACAGHPVL